MKHIISVLLLAWWFIFGDWSSPNYGPTTIRHGPFESLQECERVRMQLPVDNRRKPYGCYRGPVVDSKQEEKKSNGK